MIPLKRSAVAVVGVALKLDYDLFCGPQGIDLEAVDGRVAEGFGKPCFANQVEEAAFQLGAGSRGGRGLGK